MSEPTFEQITMAAIAFVGNDMWDSLDRFGKAKARTRARQALIVAAPSPSPAPGVVEALPENVLEDAAKAAFIKAQSVYRGLHDHLPLKNTWETLTESIRDGWRAIAHAALEAAYMPPLGTQPEPRLPRDVPPALASLSQPAKGEREGGE